MNVRGAEDRNSKPECRTAKAGAGYAWSLPGRGTAGQKCRSGGRMGGTPAVTFSVRAGPGENCEKAFETRKCLAKVGALMVGVK